MMDREIKHKKDKLTEFLRTIRAPDKSIENAKKYLDSLKKNSYMKRK